MSKDNHTDPNLGRPIKLKSDEIPDQTPENLAELEETIKTMGDHLPDPPPPPPPPFPYDSFDINAKILSGLFPRAERPAEAGERNRVTLTYTITPETDEKWRDFLLTFMGRGPYRGGGISSAAVELSMLLFMAVVADFNPKAVGYLLNEIANSEDTKVRMRESLRVLSEQLG